MIIQKYVMYKVMYIQFYINEVHYLTSFKLSKIHNNQNIVMIQMQIPNLQQVQKINNPML